MSHVNTDANVLLQTVKNLQTAISSIEATKSSIHTKYQNLGGQWKDKKYNELGEVVSECTKSLNTILKTLLQGQKYVALLAQSIQEYENTNLNGGSGSGLSASAQTAASQGGGKAPRQTEHRSLITNRDEAIAAIMEDVQRGSGKQISAETAENMYVGIQAYSGEFYGAVRSAYNNPNASATWVEKMEAIDDYIRSAPKWEGQIFRGINISESVAQGILERGEVDMLGPSSWSSAEHVAQHFSLGEQPVNMVFMLNNNQSGASITHIATYNGHESEVLAPSGVMYGIDGSRELFHNGRRYIYVDVHELHS